MQIYDHSPRVIVMDMQSLLTFDNNRIFDIFFLILCCTEVPRLVETCFWLVKPEHVLAIWLLSSNVKFELWKVSTVILIEGG